MPYHYNLDAAQHLVLSTAYGVLTNADIRNCYRTLVGDFRFHPSMDHLMNCVDVTRTRISAETIHRIGRRSPFGAGSRRAIVVPSEEAFTYVRLFRALAEDKHAEFQIFFSLNDALKFLGRDQLVLVDSRRPKILPTERAIFRQV